MKTSLFSLAGIFPALTLLPVHGQALGNPVVSTPGTATWSTEVTDTGNRTVFTITGNTVLDWGSFNLDSGSELVFDFVGGDTVANMLGGSGVNFISGTVTSNGNVGFFSPNAELVVDGSVTAKSVTIAALDVDRGAFLSGGSYTMNGNPNGWNELTVTGQIQATDGDVVLAGRLARVTGTLQASRAIQIAGGTDVTVNESGDGARLKVNSGGGFVLHHGESRASRIEIAAGQEITNGGRLDAGSNENRIFLEVGNDGNIIREGGLMVGRASINGKFDDDGIAGDPHEGDSGSAVSPSALRLPALKRPDGSKASSSRTIVNEVPISASADSGRDRKRSSRQVASREKSLLKRASFFGMRGGSSGAKR